MKVWKIVLMKLNLMKSKITNMEENIYFNAGDVVELKQDIPNKPKMIVVKKVTSIFKHEDKKDKKAVLLGIKCMWFTKDGLYQENVFNTKDLILVK